ncbi:dihydropteroate synthase [Gracilinema caldarium]|uniref:dihydropteroate synthase n=1 Tax=Gracilinema caldarium TaxID=215591 RepID=UPI0026EF9FFF|nr:dihydropteroate synthase [Gracilinema caldarium]
MISNIKLLNGSLLDLSGPPLVMAIVNCNEDSFYAPSRALAEQAVERALEAAAAGAAIIDFGAESTRPGSEYVDADTEIKRLIPVLRQFVKQSSVPVSVDTRKAAVARAALEEGALIINDISALQDDSEMAALCAARGAAVVLMHKKGIPATMQDQPYYDDVVAEVNTFLRDAAQRAEAAGIGMDKIILDPGIGFGKRLQDNLDLLAHLAEIGDGMYPLLVGVSRKSFIGAITGRAPEERLAGTLAAHAAAYYRGAKILRVHDVKETVDFIKVLKAIDQSKG